MMLSRRWRQAPSRRPRARPQMERGPRGRTPSRRTPRHRQATIGVTKAKKSLASSLVELVVIVGVALGVALAVQAFVVKPYEIPSGSMEPTLHINQRVLVNRLGMHFDSPSVGEIIVFHPPKNFDQAARTRPRAGPTEPQSARPATSRRRQAVLADLHQARRRAPRRSPLDRQRTRDTATACASATPTRPPATVPASATFPATITVPRGDYYMMGDNRPDSLDSRFWGPVPKAWIIGKAFFTYWPPDRIGLL